MELIQLVIFTAFIVGLTWFYLHLFFYDPKSQIKRLWKEIHEYNKYLTNPGVIAGKKVVGHDPLGETYEERQKQAGELINALLEYHFSDNEDEKEYILENRRDHREN